MQLEALYRAGLPAAAPPGPPPIIFLQHPFSMLLCGPSGSGKSFWVYQLLKRKDMINPPPKRIIWSYKRFQPLYKDIKREVPNIEFMEGLPPNLECDSFCDTQYPTLFIVDDLMSDATTSNNICDIFVEGSHHRNISIICLLQNMYYKGKEMRTMSLNTHYLTVFKNPRDKQQISVLARQMYPTNPSYLLEEFERATKRAHGYLLIDLKQNTPENQRLWSDIFKVRMENMEAFDDLINKMYAKYDKKYSKLVDLYENQGMENAEQKAADTLKPEYEKTFLKIYKNFLINTYELNKNILHDTIKQTLERHMSEGYSIPKAASLSIDAHLDQLEELFKDI